MGAPLGGFCEVKTHILRQSLLFQYLQLFSYPRQVLDCIYIYIFNNVVDTYAFAKSTFWTDTQPGLLSSVAMTHGSEERFQLRRR